MEENVTTTGAPVFEGVAYEVGTDQVIDHRVGQIRRGEVQMVVLMRTEKGNIYVHTSPKTIVDKAA